MDFFDVAHKLPLLQGLGQRNLELLATQVHLKSFEKGELLFYEGDETFHALLSSPSNATIADGT